MLTCIRKAFDLIRLHEGEDLDLAAVPQARMRASRHALPRRFHRVFQVETAPRSTCCRA